MKAILIILVVALGGLTYKFQLDAKAAKALVVAAEDAEFEAKTEAKEAAEALTQANKKIASLESAVANHLAEIDTLKRAEIDRVAASKPRASTDPATPVPDAGEVVSSIQARLDEMEKIYNQNLAQINDQRARLDANYTRVSGEMEVLQSNPPSFAEQKTGALRANGTRQSTGIRTSAADREEVMEEHKAALANLTAQLAAIREEQTKLNTREQELNSAYRSARSKIVAE